MAFIELLGAEQELNEKAQKRADARSKKREELAQQMEEESHPGDASNPNPEA
jgi:large subunit ribosomal protein L17